MSYSSLHSKYCPNVNEELGKVAIRGDEQVITYEEMKLCLMIHIGQIQWNNENG